MRLFSRVNISPGSTAQSACARNKLEVMPTELTAASRILSGIETRILNTLKAASVVRILRQLGRPNRWNRPRHTNSHPRRRA